MKKWYTVYCVEKAIWGALRNVHHYFKTKENAAEYAKNTEYTSNPYSVKVNREEYENIEFED